MIKNFKDRETEQLFNGERIRTLPPDLLRRAFNKLLLIHAASTLQDLRVPPSNHLESLSGDRKGQYSIRINDKYRICFRWQNTDATDVEIVDYHK